ncbi:hypothetical protein WJX84_010246 [Apatococcus fuscideae]|uniref:Intron-binding protein aquarius n=1 Tax=Apatococcus fuscideae TaxID=2026836 RepID=A0AAW1T0Z7_9CHLO
MVSTYERRRFQTEIINDMPLYPTEAILWDENQVPSVHYTGETCLALPKLNLQFLDPTDYLLRNFNLFRLEATYEIREDIADVLGRVGCTRDDDDNVVFKGWARMALPLVDFAVIEVQKPNVGENRPASVTADIVINTAGLRGDVRSEWDEVKQHDVLFLMTIDPPEPGDVARLTGAGTVPSPAERHGLSCVRGCEVLEVKDEEGSLMNDFTGRVKREDWKPPAGLKRTITVALDTAQYQMDMNHLQAVGAGAEDPYAGFNLLMRRKPKENNFKAVLESIRDLMNEVAIMPDWLEKVFLGYGDPAAAMYQNLPNQLRTIDFKDTFLDAQHVRDSFPGHTVQFVDPRGQPDEAPKRPFRVTFPAAPQPHSEGQKGVKRKRGEAAEADEAAGTEAAPAAATSSKAGSKPASAPTENGTAANGNAAAAETDEVDATAAPGAAAAADSTQLIAQSYVPQDPGPYPQDKPPENAVRFTPVQVEAIKSGVQPGLTMVVGPPGTGKTDTAVQIMHVLYHNCPGQRTLLITHSNQALNDLFEKILQRDVPARYLLRLGMGEQELATELDFSRVGRVNAMLARRLQLLAEVEKMAKQFNVAEDMAYTCESAGYFWLLHVLSRWERFQSEAQRVKTAECVKELFPFKEYFADAPEQLFHSSSFAADMEKARGCFRHLRTMFQELEECRAFELLKGQADRVNYLMTKQAKIVAMTCTHAALKRREFLQLGFKYDNLLMEESAQILEIETFIPMLLQKQEDGLARLKRVILIGDHHQLPPVVKNMAFQKHSHLDQSLFTRFVRLGMPYLQLNAQGRARPGLANLYNWRYQQLGDLPNVQQQPAYLQANAGLAFDYQFIDVPDYYLPNDPTPRGESEPIPHFYQNVGEAEYLVTWYQYMRLAGYPANKISILTTYNGQKALLRDVIENRCAGHPAFGRPHKVATVDKYQGQQNDYILLSLVRTRAVGHIRDVRRLVVAMSRSRLGLYIFGRQSLFANCYELQPTLTHLLKRPTVPALHPREHVQDAKKRPVGVSGQPLLMPSYQHMAQLVEEKRLEWEAATANAAVAGLGNAAPEEEVYAEEDDA